jgi:hypothetical protein
MKFSDRKFSRNIVLRHENLQMGAGLARNLALRNFVDHKPLVMPPPGGIKT